MSDQGLLETSPQAEASETSLELGGETASGGFRDQSRARWGNAVFRYNFQLYQTPSFQENFKDHMVSNC